MRGALFQSIEIMRVNREARFLLSATRAVCRSRWRAFPARRTTSRRRRAPSSRASDHSARTRFDRRCRRCAAYLHTASPCRGETRALRSRRKNRRAWLRCRPSVRESARATAIPSSTRRTRLTTRRRLRKRILHPRCVHAGRLVVQVHFVTWFLREVVFLSPRREERFLCLCF